MFDYWSTLFGDMGADQVVREYDLRVAGRSLEEWLDRNEASARSLRIEIPDTGREKAFAELSSAIEAAWLLR